VPSVIILGTDAVLAASPATPVQLAHACLAAGYTTVVPQSWGDELLATACTQQIARRSTSPAIFCACPLVANRLLGVGSDLGQFMISLVAPPVATARYVRALYRGAAVRVTYVGRCPSGGDESIDARVVPAEFLTMLAERGINILEQPEVFDSVLPPDRRRYASLPGGLPSPDTLQREGSERAIVELSGADLPTQLTRELLSQGTALLDLSLRQGCVCSGAAPGIEPNMARALVAAVEPPHSATPVIDTAIAVKVDLPLPRGSRDPADIVAATSLTTSSVSAPPPALATPTPIVTSVPSAPMPRMAVPPVLPATAPVVDPAPPIPMADAPLVECEGEAQSESLRRRAPVASPARAVSGVMPTTRRGEGAPLPRAYVARRRPSHAVAQLPDEMATAPSMRETPFEVPREAPREVPREAPRDIQHETERVIEHSVEPPRTPPSSRWASVPAAVPLSHLETEVPAASAPTWEPPPAPAPTSQEAVPIAPAPPAPAPTSQEAAPIAPAPHAPSPREEVPPPVSSPPQATGESPAAARHGGPNTAPRASEPPALLRGLRVELLIAAAVGVGLIAGIVAGRQMNHAAAAPTAGEANARAGAGSAAAPRAAPASALPDTERGAVASPPDERRAAEARVEPGRRPRARQPQRASEATSAPADGATIRGRDATTRRPVTDTVIPSAPVREPEVAPAATTDSLTPVEREALERELRVRRARLDSLARRLDSLRPPPEAPL
jgi:hypothetical protein